MMLVAFLLLYLAIKKQFEPLLLLPIAFGMFLANLPLADLMYDATAAGGHWYESGVLRIMYMGVKLSLIHIYNMTPEQMAEAIRIIDGRAETECSGNITRENIKTITSLGVDYVSSGALTHSAPILDISLKHLRAVEE